MRSAILLSSSVPILLSCVVLRAQAGETVDQIMSRVGANQDRSESLRAAFVYRQTLRLRFHRGGGKVARDEEREYVVTPTEKGTRKELVKFQGHYEKDGEMIPYSEPGFEYKDVDIDGSLINDLADDLANDGHSRDGIAAELFPLTTKEQQRYTFALKGTEDFRGRRVYRIDFKPKRDTRAEPDGTPWAGEILVDAADYQPVNVTTRLAKGLPIAVRTLLGTNLRGLGFQVRYDRFDEGLWFPVSYGAEFEVKALFLYKRRIAIAMSNKEFQRAQVDTCVTYGQPLSLDKTLKIPEIRIPPH